MEYFIRDAVNGRRFAIVKQRFPEAYTEAHHQARISRRMGWGDECHIYGNAQLAVYADGGVSHWPVELAWRG